jgi:hypothetical protein
MKQFRKVLLTTALFALSACATGPKISGHLSAQQVEEFMARGVLAGVFAGHDRIVVTMDNGEVYTAGLPDIEKLEAYVNLRKSTGKPFDYAME